MYIRVWRRGSVEKKVGSEKKDYVSMYTLETQRPGYTDPLVYEVPSFPREFSHRFLSNINNEIVPNSTNEEIRHRIQEPQ